MSAKLTFESFDELTRGNHQWHRNEQMHMVWYDFSSKNFPLFFICNGIQDIP